MYRGGCKIGYKNFELFAMWEYIVVALQSGDRITRLSNLLILGKYLPIKKLINKISGLLLLNFKN